MVVDFSWVSGHVHLPLRFTLTPIPERKTESGRAAPRLWASPCNLRTASPLTLLRIAV
jgi:hypothetical protein